MIIRRVSDVSRLHERMLVKDRRGAAMSAGDDKRGGMRGPQCEVMIIGVCFAN